MVPSGTSSLARDTLPLTGLSWSEIANVEDSDVPASWTATATYSKTTYTNCQEADGYQATAVYKGEAAKTGPSCGAADVPSGSWYTNAVNAFYDAGIETSSFFWPDAAISRAELSVWLYRLSGSPYVAAGTIAFPDVPTAGETHDAVAYGQLHSWINGYPDGTFRPNHSITRVEAAKLINRGTSRSLRVPSITTRFADVPAAHWAYWEIVSAANQRLRLRQPLWQTGVRLFRRRSVSAIRGVNIIPDTRALRSIARSTTVERARERAESDHLIRRCEFELFKPEEQTVLRDAITWLE